MIEEMFKPIGVWLFAGKLKTPVQGFALGVLSGAAYALVESMTAGSQAGEGWAVVVAARTGTSVIHIATTGLVGWGIASAWLERKYLRLLGLYALAISLHGLWNASSIMIGLHAIADFAGDGARYEMFSVAAAIMMAALILGCIALLFFANARARDVGKTAAVHENEAAGLAMELRELAAESGEKDSREGN
jgi:hypothetical protein